MCCEWRLWLVTPLGARCVKQRQLNTRSNEQYIWSASELESGLIPAWFGDNLVRRAILRVSKRFLNIHLGSGVHGAALQVSHPAAPLPSQPRLSTYVHVPPVPNTLIRRSECSSRRNPAYGPASLHSYLLLHPSIFFLILFFLRFPQSGRLRICNRRSRAVQLPLGRISI